MKIFTLISSLACFVGVASCATPAAHVRSRRADLGGRSRLPHVFRVPDGELATATSKKSFPSGAVDDKGDRYTRVNGDNENESGTYVKDEPPLILTPLLSTPDKARELSRFSFPVSDGGTFDGHSGFFEVDPVNGGDLFFLLAPGPDGGVNPKCLTLWLQGGPGSSSLFGLFAENGPVTVNPAADGLDRSSITWATLCDMIYIDNPVGTGFSYVRNETGGLPTNEDQVGAAMYEMMQQFYVVFPQYAGKPFFVTGESYGGHYVPALASKIVQGNAAGKQPRINLVGVAIGDGWIDLETQIQGYSKIVAGTGLAEGSQLDQIRALQDRGTELARGGDWHGASQAFVSLVDGDGYSLLTNFTGLPDYDDIRKDVTPPYPPYGTWVKRPEITAQLHAGTGTLAVPFGAQSDAVANALFDDMARSTKPDLANVLEAGVRVLLYNGQFDLVVGAATTEAMVPTIPWSGIFGWNDRSRRIWHERDSGDGGALVVAGYVKGGQSDNCNLTQIVLRGAGHLVPFDQPARAFEMFSRFVTNEW